MQFIAIFEFLKGLGALIVAVGLFDLIEQKKLGVLNDILSHTHPDAFRNMLRAGISKVEALDGHEAKLILLFGILYAGLRFVEGIGLWREAQWGRQIGIWSALLYLPFEIYEIFHEFTLIKLLITMLNIGVVFYLWKVKIN